MSLARVCLAASLVLLRAAGSVCESVCDEHSLVQSQPGVALQRQAALQSEVGGPPTANPQWLRRILQPEELPFGLDKLVDVFTNMSMSERMVASMELMALLRDPSTVDLLFDCVENISDSFLHGSEYLAQSALNLSASLARAESDAEVVGLVADVLRTQEVYLAWAFANFTVDSRKIFKRLPPGRFKELVDPVLKTTEGMTRQEVFDSILETAMVTYFPDSVTNATTFCPKFRTSAGGAFLRASKAVTERGQDFLVMVKELTPKILRSLSGVAPELMSTAERLANTTLLSASAALSSFRKSLPIASSVLEEAVDDRLGCGILAEQPPQRSAAPLAGAHSGLLAAAAVAAAAWALAG